MNDSDIKAGFIAVDQRIRSVLYLISPLQSQLISQYFLPFFRATIDDYLSYIVTLNLESGSYLCWSLRQTVAIFS